MRSYLWIFLVAALVTGVKSEEGDVSEAAPEEEAVPTDSTPLDGAAPEEGSPTEAAPAPEEGPDVNEDTEGTAGTDTEAPAEEEAPAEGTQAAPVDEEGAPAEDGADTSDAAIPDGTAAPAKPETEEETQGEADSGDETAPGATEAPAESEPEADADTDAGGSDTATGETSPDDATEAPVSEKEEEAPIPKEEVKPVEGGFDLSDALGPDNEPPADSGPIEGKARSAGAASDAEGVAEEQKEGGSGQIVGILVGIGVAIVGAASGYFAYQKKKLCFKPEADPESARKEDPATQAEPQVLSNLLSSS